MFTQGFQKTAAIVPAFKGLARGVNAAIGTASGAAGKYGKKFTQGVQEIATAGRTQRVVSAQKAGGKLENLVAKGMPKAEAEKHLAAQAQKRIAKGGKSYERLDRMNAYKKNQANQSFASKYPFATAAMIGGAGYLATKQPEQEQPQPNIMYNG